MKIYKKILGIIAAFILLAAPLAFAAGEDVINTDTGNGSNNQVSFCDDSSVSIKTNNTKTENNDVFVEQTTGANVALGNEGENDSEEDVTEASAIIATGNASANVSIGNTENISEVSVGGAQEEEEEGEQEEVTPSGGGIGGGEITEVVTPAGGGIGGGEISQAAAGIGGGELPETGFDGLIWPFILASVTTILSYFRLKRGLRFSA